MIHNGAPMGGFNMPVTESVAAQIGPGGLSGLTILHINHLLKDVLDLNQLLVHLGASLLFVPVIYGTKQVPTDLPYPLIYSYQTDEGFALYVGGRLVGPAPAEMEEAVKVAIRLALQQPEIEQARQRGDKILILEDGGYHFSLMADQPILPSVIGAIEQTKAGVRSARKLIEEDGGALYPILSIARSKLKIRFENYFIARRVVEETTLMLYELEEFLAFRDILLIGYGIIGRPMAFLLQRLDCRVMVLEKESRVRQTASAEGFETVDEVTRDQFDNGLLVLGATGVAAFSLPMFGEFLKSRAADLYLVSSSSKRVEFAPLIRFLEGSSAERASLGRRQPGVAGIDAVCRTHSAAGQIFTFIHRQRQRRVVLLADGYPVNFYRPQSQSLPARIIDPINAELLLLVHYLFNNHASLRSRLYLLGLSQLPGLFAEEEELLALWQRYNPLSGVLVQAALWDLLNPHPNERWLGTHG